MAQKMAKKKGVAQKMAVKNYSVENMAVNNLWVHNMAKIKYKVENKLPFQNMATNVETSQDNKQQHINNTYMGYWHTLATNRNIQDITVTQRK